jgi:glycerol-3-phosphate dehydrogenase
MTKAFCEKHNVAYRTTGKIVVAKNAEEEPRLLALKKKGEENGVAGLRLLDAAGIRAREAHVRGYVALDVPSTGICSAEELVHAFARIAESQGANLVNRARVESLEAQNDSIVVGLRIGDEQQWETETISARCVINSAGLYADEVAQLLGPRPWKIYPVRGEYCQLRGAKAALVNNLVYPLPHSGGLTLGLHFTKTVWGTTLVGPTARYVESKENYERERMTISEFAADVKSLIPEIEPQDMHLAHTGLRPKLVPPDGHGIADFVIEPDREVPRVIQLVGIESPGLTAAPAIAEYVANLAAEVVA